MDTQRAQTYEVLEAFIQSQRALLQRTNQEVEHLRRLRQLVVENPAGFVSDYREDKLPDALTELSDPSECTLSLPKFIQWSSFDYHDPAPFQKMAASARSIVALRNQPYPKQRSELSDLQKLVKEARQTIVDPVLAKCRFVATLSDAELDEDDPEEQKRTRERANIKELKLRKSQAHGKKPPGRGLSRVYIRHDVEDESLDVDVSEDASAFDTTLASTPMDIDTPTTSIPASISVSSTPPIAPTLHSVPRTRKASAKQAQAQQAEALLKASASSRTRSKVKPPVQQAPPKTSGLRTEAEASVVVTTSRPSRDLGKPKPETYKQAWTVSEQNLLEQLLEEIPDGEKNRWLKVSRAMNGRRTPRQVASRVQKYFEKLKRFGLGTE